MKKFAFKCVNCKKIILDKNKTFPFCSKKCSNVDLYKWLENKYFITKELDFDN